MLLNFISNEKGTSSLVTIDYRYGQKPDSCSLAASKLGRVGESWLSMVICVGKIRGVKIEAFCRRDPLEVY